MEIEYSGTHLSLSAEKPADAGQACSLFDKTAKNSIRHKDGSLELNFADATRLTVAYDELKRDFENFQRFFDVLEFMTAHRFHFDSWTISDLVVYLPRNHDPAGLS